MNTIRAFIAVEIGQLHKQKLSDLITHLKQSDTHIKWSTEGQMHFTLKFLGNIASDKVQKISEILMTVAGDFAPFSIRFSNIGAFPNMRRPRVIWIGIDKGSESLKLLNNKIETELGKLGWTKEKREYKAHLTLGRVKSLKNVAKLAHLINETDFQLQDEIKIDKVILFRSTLTPHGAIYTPLAEYILSPSPATHKS